MTGRKRKSNPTGSASLLDPHAVGGLDAWNGFDRQCRYIALRIPGWLKNPFFVRFTPERSEDVDVVFQAIGGEYIDHHQVKSEEITASRLRDLVLKFQERNRKNIENGVVRRFVVASARVSSDVQNLFRAVERYRATDFVLKEAETTQRATLDDLHRRISTLGLLDIKDSLREWVALETDFVGAESAETTLDMVAVGLAQLPSFSRHLIAPLQSASQQLLASIGEHKRYVWTREELEQFLNRAILEYLNGPPKPAGDLVLLKHQSIQRVTQDIRPEVLPPQTVEHRHIQHCIDSLEVARSCTIDSLQRAVKLLVTPDGAFRRILDAEPPAELVYFGFPHVPLAVLAGFVTGQQRHVYVLEHDRDTGLFAWAPDNAMSVSFRQIEIERRGGSVARLRVSISSEIRRELCIVPNNEVGLDIHIGAESPAFDLVRNERIAREFAASMRKFLSSIVCGDPNITELHVFAAVPVSIAFLLGQVLSANALPRTLVYNYSGGTERRYNWSLCLQEVLSINQGVALITQSTGN
jgi:hypothetical protein